MQYGKRFIIESSYWTQSWLAQHVHYSLLYYIVLPFPLPNRHAGYIELQCLHFQFKNPP